MTWGLDLFVVGLCEIGVCMFEKMQYLFILNSKYYFFLFKKMSDQYIYLFRASKCKHIIAMLEKLFILKLPI